MRGYGGRCRCATRLARIRCATRCDTDINSLPPYSPDLNPIEQAFAKIKHWMRNAQRRDFEDTWRHLGHLIGTIEPTECQNYIRNVGLVPSKTDML